MKELKRIWEKVPTMQHTIIPVIFSILLGYTIINAFSNNDTQQEKSQIYSI